MVLAVIKDRILNLIIRRYIDHVNWWNLKLRYVFGGVIYTDMTNEYTCRYIYRENKRSLII